MQFSLLQNNLSSLFIYICTITSHPFISRTSSQENPHYFSRHFNQQTRIAKAQENNKTKNGIYVTSSGVFLVCSHHK